MQIPWCHSRHTASNHLGGKPRTAHFKQALEIILTPVIYGQSMFNVQSNLPLEVINQEMSHCPLCTGDCVWRITIWQKTPALHTWWHNGVWAVSLEERPTGPVAAVGAGPVAPMMVSGDGCSDNLLLILGSNLFLPHLYWKRIWDSLQKYSFTKYTWRRCGNRNKRKIGQERKTRLI